MYPYLPKLAEWNPIFEDVPWREAAERRCHEWNLRFRGGVSRVTVGLATLPDVKRLPEVMFYGSHRNADEFIGLSELFNTTDPKEAQCAVNVSDGGGRGSNNGSIYLVVWGVDHVYMVYPPPPGQLLGLPAQEGSAVPVEAGLAVVDWRYVFRAANIDTRGAAGDDFDIAEVMTKALLHMPSLGNWRNADDLRGARPVFYMGEAVHKLFRAQCGDRTIYRDIPVRVVKELRNDEPRVN